MKMKRTYLLSFVLLILSHQNILAKGRGEDLYNTCEPCHGPHGFGNKKQLAPAIAGMQEWYIINQLKGFRKGARGLHPDDAGGIRMRPMARTLGGEEDIKLVAKYVSSLPRAKIKETLDGRPLKGRQAYAVCAGCHGPNGKGMKAVGGPDLTVTQDWYLLTQLKNFKHGLRGADPAKDPLGATMAGMAQTVPDEQAMKDLIKYIQSLR